MSIKHALFLQGKTKPLLQVVEMRILMTTPKITPEVIEQDKKIKQQMLKSLRAGFDVEMKAIEKEQQEILLEIIRTKKDV